MQEETQNIVIDLGTKLVRAGMAGDDAPRAVFPNIVGRPRYLGVMVGMAARDSYLGDHCESTRGILQSKSPVENGIVVNWDDWEKIIHHTFYNELRIDPEKHAVFMPSPILNPTSNLSKMAQIMFETFNVPAFASAYSPTLCSYASGSGTGFVVECGAGVTQIVPIYQNCVINEAVIRCNFGGNDITQYLQTMLQGKGHCLKSSAGFRSCEKLKEAQCYVASQYDEEMNKHQSGDHSKTELQADGRPVVLREEMFKAPEAIFQPKLVGQEMPGLGHLVYESIMRCPIDIRNNFYGNIIVAGGNTMFPGFPDRLQSEIMKIAPKTMKIKVIAPPERKFSTWIGGSVLTSLSTFQKLWMSKADYDELGPDYIHMYGCVATDMEHSKKSLAHRRGRSTYYK